MENKTKRQNNLDKWNQIIETINQQADNFIKSLDLNIPEKFYVVELSGSLYEKHITGTEYRFEFPTYFYGKKPTNADLETLQKNSQNIEFKQEKISLNFYYYWGENHQARSSIKYNDLKKENNFLVKEEAEIYSAKINEINESNKRFDELHKKDTSYDYNGNGYKFLGWQNGWKHVYYDAEGNITTDVAKRKAFGYSKEDHPEYGNCRESGHRVIEVSHSRTGSNNVVSCPECKIYWKYDCSD